MTFKQTLRRLEETLTYVGLFFFTLYGAFLMMSINFLLGVVMLLVGGFVAKSIYFKLVRGWYFKKKT